MVAAEETTTVSQPARMELSCPVGRLVNKAAAATAADPDQETAVVRTTALTAAVRKVDVGHGKSWERHK